MSKENEIDWKAFPPTIAHLAAAIGVRPESLWTYLSSIIGGLAGSFARIYDSIGIPRDPACSLILIDDHPGRTRRLAQIGIEPAVYLNDRERRKSLTFVPKWYWKDVENRPLSIRSSHTALLEAHHRPGAIQSEIEEPLELMWNFRLDSHPSILINAPTPEVFPAAMKSNFDHCPLIVDTGGRILRKVLHPTPGKQEWISMLEHIRAGAGSGAESSTSGTEHGGLGDLAGVQRSRTPFCTHLPAELLGAALLNPHTADLLEVALAVSPEPIKGRLSQSHLPTAKDCLATYRTALNRVVKARLQGCDLSFELQQHLPAWEQACQKIEADLDAQPGEVRRYCGGLYDLPLRLLFTALIIDDPEGSNPAAFTQAAINTAQRCVDNQTSLISAALREEEYRELIQAASVMLEKLRNLSLPCRLSDLLRRYHQQHKSRHLPTLAFLQDEGLVAWCPDSNQINLTTPNSRPAWLNNTTQLAT